LINEQNPDCSLNKTTRSLTERSLNSFTEQNPRLLSEQNRNSSGEQKPELVLNTHNNYGKAGRLFNTQAHHSTNAEKPYTNPAIIANRPGVRLLGIQV
jgi:hypothetical protein